MEKPSIDAIDQIMLIQPNNVTFGRYSFNPIQENILTLAIDALQKHATKQAVIQTDLWGQPKITVICDEAAGMNNKSAVKIALRDMLKKPFEFKWTHPNMGKPIETGGIIFSTWHDILGTNRIELTLNVWAIPFLVYYGVGVGGTHFNKAIALNLDGEYPKRIYKMICRWKDKSSFKYSITQLRLDLDLPTSYDNTKIEERVLKPSRDKIKESSSDVWFEYEMLCEQPKKGRKPKADTILFKIKNNKPQETTGENFDRYNFVYRWLCDCFNPMKSDKARTFADKLNEMGELEKVYNRCIYWDDLITTGKNQMTSIKAQNSLKKLLREDYKLS